MAFGVLFATVMILVVVPCLYPELEDGKAGFRWLDGREARHAAPPVVGEAAAG